ncbi:MAG TPA: amidohydrolase/deacetylase family metallohydrolase [Thermoproteota archaeon]|nr:amidohydrolase/deacetylase family metallohydrolase [Thermoproteota archaeon]
MGDYDLLVKGGTLVDPSQGIGEQRDVAVSDGKVAEIRRGLSTSSAKQVVDADGLIVAPGLVDIHTHVYDAVMPLGINPDLCCLSKGTTTAVDAGSSGYLNFPGLKEHIIDRSSTRIYALLNIGSLGLMTYGTDLEPLQTDPRQVDVANTVRAIRENRDSVVGIKWHSTYGPKALLSARAAADKAGTIMMCENSAASWVPVSSVLDYMKRGDILTHAFQGGPAPGILDENGSVKPEVLKAVKRGVVIDVGHGAGSFSFETAEKAIGQGLLPDVISTDLHARSVNGPVFDMPTTLSKFLALGLSVEDVVIRATSGAARAVGLQNGAGTLRVGAAADVVVLRLETGDFVFEDSLGKKRKGERRLITDTVVRGGLRV